MKINFHPLAQLELKEAIAFLEKQDFGLGFAFAKEIKLTLNRIRQYPKAWSKTFKKCRRCLVNRFNYGVVYKISEKSITIFAVMHLAQNPTFWFDRIRKRNDKE